MLTNGGFEGSYTERGAPEVKVALGWEPFWATGDPPKERGQGPCARPEYKPVLAAQFPYRVKAGLAAQCWFLNYRVMDAGILQRVKVQAGRRYEFWVAAHAWCSNGDDPHVSDGEMYLSLGLDLGGGTNPFEQGVVWTPWRLLGADYARCGTLAVTALTEQMTVYVRAWNKWRLKHNDVYVDEAELNDVSAGPPPEPGTAAVDYDRIRQIVREELNKGTWVWS